MTHLCAFTVLREVIKHLWVGTRVRINSVHVDRYNYTSYYHNPAFVKNTFVTLFFVAFMNVFIMYIKMHVFINHCKVKIRYIICRFPFAFNALYCLELTMNSKILKCIRNVVITIHKIIQNIIRYITSQKECIKKYLYFNILIIYIYILRLHITHF